MVGRLRVDNSMRAEIHKAKIAALIAQYGCVPTDAPSGPVVERFSPGRLADAIEQEIKRGAEYGWTKITLHMDVPDAMRLARHLRSR